MKKNILLIFDCFGVVVAEIAPVWFESRFPVEEAKVLKEKYFQGADLGDVSISELLDRVSGDLGIPRETIIGEWESIFKVNYELADLIGRLKENYHIALLSNAPLGLVEKILEEFDLAGIFDKTFISANHRMAKPDKAFYKLCIDSFGKMDAIYMIDGNPTNLSGLDSLNIRPHLFRSNDLFLEYLKEENLIKDSVSSPE